MATRSKNENINISIFSALKVSELSGVPVLIMSNPGMGKSTTVAMFAEVRGYKLQLLRGNSTSAEEVLGYDAIPTKEMAMEVGDTKATAHFRPSWFSEVLKNHEEGKPTLLFLDEITTAPEHVQSALLHLIFERYVGTEKLPEDTLIVSAGNYAQNLSNQMGLLPPLMNRFMIYNIVPKSSDLDTFLNFYEGSLASSGKRVDKMDALRKTMEQLDAQELKITESNMNMIGEYIERSIRETTRMLMEGSDKVIDLSVTDLQSLYSDTTDDQILYGFTTLRTLGYLTRVTLAAYRCFGKKGLSSAYYQNMVDGLCGLGISRDPKNKGEVRKTRITKNYIDSMKVVANDIEKMSNTTLGTYETFFKDIINHKTSAGTFSSADLKALEVKIDEMLNDNSLKNIERPIDPSLFKDLLSIMKVSIQEDLIKNEGLSIKSSDDLRTIPAEKFATVIQKWNAIASTYISIEKVVTKKDLNYGTDVVNDFGDLKSKITMANFKIAACRKAIMSSVKGAERIIPEVVELKTKKV